MGTIIVDKTQTFLYVVRPNVSALRYRIGVGPECTTLAGLYHVVKKEELSGGNQQQSGLLGARVLYLNNDRRIHGSSAPAASGPLPEGCIRRQRRRDLPLRPYAPGKSRRRIKLTGTLAGDIEVFKWKTTFRLCVSGYD